MFKISIFTIKCTLTRDNKSDSRAIDSDEMIDGRVKPRWNMVINCVYNREKESDEETVQLHVWKEQVGHLIVQKDTNLQFWSLHMSFHLSYLCFFMQFHLYIFNGVHNLEQRSKTYQVIQSEIRPSVEVEFSERVVSLLPSMWQSMHSDLRRREICYGDQCCNKLHPLQDIVKF
jgi:hypothetical protein